MWGIMMEDEYKDEYRIIKHSEGDEVFYCIEECMLDDDGVMDNLEMMKKSFDKSILGSFPSIKGGCCNE